MFYHLSTLSRFWGALYGIAIREVLDRPPDFTRRVWLVCDELDSLGTVAGIADANTRGRKYGLCSVGAIQSKAQLDATYGPLGAQTLLSTFSSKISFRQGSWSDAEYWSNEFGQREVVEESTTHADTSTNAPGGGSSTTTSSQTKKIVQTILPSELAELPDRTAYCRFPGMAGIHQIEFGIRKYRPIRPAFLPPGEPEPVFEDPKVEIIEKPRAEKGEGRGWQPIAWLAGVGGVLALGGWLFYSLPDLLYAPDRKSTISVPAPQESEYRVFHWTHGTFRCRVDHSVGERPWNCIRIGPPGHPKTAAHQSPEDKKSAGPVKNSASTLHEKTPALTVMDLPVWTGPWPPWWHCLPKNAGKWVAVNRPVRDRYGNWYPGIVGQKRERMRVRCPK